jgi:hypothetical protein
MEKERGNQMQSQMITGLVVGNYVHKHLGNVRITDACVQMQLIHGCDKTSVYVENDEGEILEVSVNLIIRG